jgi:hypothetical protein
MSCYVHSDGSSQDIRAWSALGKSLDEAKGLGDTGYKASDWISFGIPCTKLLCFSTQGRKMGLQGQKGEWANGMDMVLDMANRAALAEVLYFPFTFLTSLGFRIYLGFLVAVLIYLLSFYDPYFTGFQISLRFPKCLLGIVLAVLTFSKYILSSLAST